MPASPALPEQSADDAADEAAGATAAAVMTATATAATTTVMAARGVIIGVLVAAAGLGGDDLGQQRLVLQLVEIAALGIAAGGLPARDHGAGRFVELAVDLGIEAE